jgi:hypothetical protein
MKLSTIVTVIFLFIVSVGHLLRLIFKVQEIPMQVSVVVFIATAILAIWLLIDNRQRKA